jgi:cyclic 2,3-diphosphoglycerate synthase
MKVLALIDGEHHPPVTRWAIELAVERGHEVLGALLMGGTEKLPAMEPLEVGVPVRAVGLDRMMSLSEAISELAPEAVLDLSDEPVMGYRERMEAIAVTLLAGIPYLTPDTRFDPPFDGPPVPAPTLGVIGTGKRTGKTAIAGELARRAAAAGLDPVLVAMGRGGPPTPQVAERGSVTLERLIELARSGGHAASDYLEGAVTSGVPTIGARRAGGGLAGAPYGSNVRRAAELACERDPGLVILEGSGSAVPTVPWDAGVLVVPAACPPEYLGGYLGPLRILLTDLVVVTMAASPTEGLENLSALRPHIQRFLGDARYLVTDFTPVALEDVRGKEAFLTTTAPGSAAARQAQLLEATAGCRVVGWSDGLADRARLSEEMGVAPGYDVLLTELKAAAIDVACEQALARGAEVVFVDNRATVVEGDLELPAAFDEVLELARDRGNAR